MRQSTLVAKGSRLIDWQFSGAHLNRRRADIGEIGQQRLSRDLAEYAGCDNHSNETIETQKKLMMKQLEKLRI